MEHLTILHWFTKYSFVCIPVLAFLLDLIIGDPSQGVRTRSSLIEAHDYLAFVSQIEPHSLEEVENDPN